MAEWAEEERTTYMRAEKGKTAWCLGSVSEIGLFWGFFGFVLRLSIVGGKGRVTGLIGRDLRVTSLLH